ncbi:hypothetical protein LWI29_005220 [Acer saccharum]|uniref:Uncharacterized protein n=1 Tax=Acer saccharum TaxID=4024 RepID=A0AA39W5U2_ACESA|nr:hypothetical protein LWI29_005220 [Acer saccharum]
MVAILLELQKVVEEAELRVKQSLPREVSLPTTIGSSSGSISNYFQLDLPSSKTKKRKGKNGPIKKAFNIGAREQLDGEIARMFYTAGLLVESQFKHIFWTPRVVHTLNLALKSICSPSPHPRYDDIMEECGWIAKISSDVSFIKVFIMNHNMRLAMFNDHSKLKLLSVADTRFASTIVMLKRFKQIKQGLQQMPKKLFSNLSVSSTGLSFSHSSLKLPVPLSATALIIPSIGAAVVAALSLAATAHSCTASCQITISFRSIHMGPIFYIFAPCPAVAQEGSRVRQAASTSLYF